MSFQKCPVCEGSGQVQRFGLSPVCHVCSGHGIIDEVTGQPPVSTVTVSNSEDVYIAKSPTVAPPNYAPYTTSGDTFDEAWAKLLKKINS